MRFDMLAQAQPNPRGRIVDALQPRTEPQFEVRLAANRREIEEAQRLRFQVFFEELGARAASARPGRRTLLDIDEYDADCEHLLVRELSSLQVVGCYRIMRPEIAFKRGSYYSDSEFDLSRLLHLKANMAEVGRACIHPEYRTGSVIMLLWSGLAKFMMGNGIQHVIGCASVSLADGGANALAIHAMAQSEWLSPSEYRVFPRHPYPLRGQFSALPQLPPLIKGYARLGAWIGGDPAWDPDFNTADFFTLLSLDRMPQKYMKHFMSLT
jgi:putative hemolysin